MPIFLLALGLLGAWCAWTDARAGTTERTNYVALPLLGAALTHLFP